MTLKTIALVAASLTVLAACAQKPEPISEEPVFDKYGVPSCRPHDVPVGGIYTADLPICAYTAMSPTGAAHEDSDGSDNGDDDSPDDDSNGGGNQNQNQNNNQNRNTNENQNRAG
ncbi:hypothetical protein [Primorskyibacter sedentarius]|uniref:hypothetical protein n=1 Tax=Primorskyibacter sedentarius TaxID=745311 RepID=UPI003EBA0C17